MLSSSKASSESVFATSTSSANTSSSATAAAPACKPCCACPDTRTVRDECVITFGEESAKCQDLIKAHQDCMRSMGFNI
ncbi:hypothetical protein BJ741DRAFT_622511 [Chytriomyces cf. hyalinus JEL632]|nr:hypothetical protein BJ741DRAFT_622511 [Chytriomyces cf. hyalinus JEL632]